MQRTENSRKRFRQLAVAEGDSIGAAAAVAQGRLPAPRRDEDIVSQSCYAVASPMRRIPGILHAVIKAPQRRGYGAELALEGLSEAAVAVYLATRGLGQRFPETLVRWLHQRTESHPLLAAELRCCTAIAPHRPKVYAQSAAHWLTAYDV